jgi:dihydropyrimidinase
MFYCPPNTFMSMAIDTVITGGKVVTADDVFEASVGVDGEQIVALGDADAMPKANETVDASGLYVMPGLMDAQTHVHDRSSIDTHETAGMAAAAGGITTYIDFGWMYEDHQPHKSSQSLMDGIREKQEKAEGKAVVDYALHGGITDDDEAVLDELETAQEAGVTSFKMFTGGTFPVSYGLINLIMERLGDLGGVGVFHTEQVDVCDKLTERLKREGKGEPKYWAESRPDYAEAMAVDNVLRLAQEHGAKYFGIHTTSRAAADVIDSYRDDGSLVRAETCTHYTVYDESEFDRRGNLVKIAPPLRKQDDVEAMFEYLDEGTLDLVSTDHCSYKRADKEVENWWDSTSGANQLQTSVPVFFDKAVNRRGYSPSFIVDVMSTNIADTYGMPNKGTLEPGTDADIVLFDPMETYTISADENFSKADFSIYEGREVTGRVEQTYVRGRRVYEDGSILAEPGYGDFVARDVPNWTNKV